MEILFFTEQWVNGGVASFIMNLLRNFDLDDNIRLDICVSENMTDLYDDELCSLGVSKNVLIGKQRTNPLVRMFTSSKQLKELLQRKKYDIVHFHLCNALGLNYARIARNCGCKTIVHSHNSGVSSGIKSFGNSLFRSLYGKIPDERYGCSDLAVQWLFPDAYIKAGKVKIIKNGINTSRFAYDPECRRKLREELGVGNKIVICHIGRYITQKNHGFLIDIYNAVTKKYSGGTKLLLIGEGPLEAQVWKRACEYGIQEDIIRICNTHNVPEYLCAADVFVLPSLFEGFPVVGIEAQASGLPCVFSSEITRQAAILPNAVFADLTMPPEKWADIIMEEAGADNDRASAHLLLKREGYDITDVAAEVKRGYFEMAKGEDFR